MPKKVTTDKFKTNPFAKKYKKSLLEIEAQKLDEQLEKYYEEQEALYAAEKVKSWKRGGISETLNLTYLFLAFIIGFSVCAIVVTPLVINSI